MARNHTALQLLLERGALVSRHSQPLADHSGLPDCSQSQSPSLLFMVSGGRQTMYECPRKGQLVYVCAAS